MRLFFLLTFSCIITQLGFCQNELPSFEDDCITFELKSDTLFSNKHVKLFIGAKVHVGSPAYESGYFASIIPKKAAIVPSHFGKNSKLEYAIQNFVASKKQINQVKESLKEGLVLEIKKILIWKNSKPNFILVLLASEAGDYYKCDIELAFRLEELFASE